MNRLKLHLRRSNAHRCGVDSSLRGPRPLGPPDGRPLSAHWQPEASSCRAASAFQEASERSRCYQQPWAPEQGRGAQA